MSCSETMLQEMPAPKLGPPDHTALLTPPTCHYTVVIAALEPRTPTPMAFYLFIFYGISLACTLASLSGLSHAMLTSTRTSGTLWPVRFTSSDTWCHQAVKSVQKKHNRPRSDTIRLLIVRGVRRKRRIDQ